MYSENYCPSVAIVQQKLYISFHCVQKPVEVQRNVMSNDILPLLHEGFGFCKLDWSTRY